MLETPSGTVDSVDYWVNMGDAIHEAHIGAILAKRSADQEPPTFYDRFGTTELGWGLVVQPRTLASERSDRRVGKLYPRRTYGQRAIIVVGVIGGIGLIWWNFSDLETRIALSATLVIVLPAAVVLAFGRRSG